MKRKPPYDPRQKFNQPVEGIKVTHHDGLHTLLPREVIDRFAARIAAGEDRDAVITELAIEMVELEDDLRAAGLLPPLVDLKPRPMKRKRRPVKRQR